MKNEKISRRSFLKASAVASALGVMAAAPAAHAAGADEAAAQIEEENCLLKKPKYIFLFIGDGMGTAFCKIVTDHMDILRIIYDIQGASHSGYTAACNIDSVQIGKFVTVF